MALRKLSTLRLGIISNEIQKIPRNFTSAFICAYLWIPKRKKKR